jgi:hypothetical protein
MKLQDSAVFVVILSAAWTVVSFAYVFGLFYDRSVALIGFVRVDDVISASAGTTAVIVGIFAPTMFIVTEIMKIFISGPGAILFSSRIAIITILSISAMALVYYILAISQKWPYIPHIFILAVSASLIVVASTYYDKRTDGRVSRVLAIFASCVLIAFATGSKPFQNSRSRCSEVSQGERVVASGRVFLAVSRGVFLEEVNTGSTMFISSEAFDLIRVSPCEKEKADG